MSVKWDLFHQNCTLVLVKISPYLLIFDDWKGLRIWNYFLHLIVVDPVASIHVNLITSDDAISGLYCLQYISGGRQKCFKFYDWLQNVNVGIENNKIEILLEFKYMLQKDWYQVATTSNINTVLENLFFFGIGNEPLAVLTLHSSKSYSDSNVNSPSKL